MESKSLGLMHFWTAADPVTHAVAWMLLAMSVLSWYLILARLLRAWRLRGGMRRALNAFWASGTIESGIQELARIDTERLFVPMAERARETISLPSHNSLADAVDTKDRITQALRQELARASARLDAGQTLLASVGSTAPFVGLFGTVWGIYHALIGIAASGQVQIDRVAGPVGEALIMTAAGLAVAIPAVLAYNALTRFNRVVTAELDGFANDLFAWAHRACAVPDNTDSRPPRAPAEDHALSSNSSPR